MGGSEWWRGATIYQVYLQSFLDSNDDGFGDLPGLLSRLDYIAELGVDAIWISPFYRSPMRDFGYDVSDYRAVDPLFGTEADFDGVVARAHGLGLRVLVDQVWSHTSSDHPWFCDSRTLPRNGKSDWYVWADARADGTPPNNWLSVFGGSAWRWDAMRRQYYLHHFLPTQPKLNLRNEEVLAQHFANAEFWLGRGVDGFRLDAIDFMLHETALPDNPPNPAVTGNPPWNLFRMQRHVHDMSNTDADALMTRIRHFMDRFPDATTVGEVSSEPGAVSRASSMTGNTRLHMAYTLGVMKSPFTVATLRQALQDAAKFNHGSCLCWSFSNHDVPRVVSRWNASGVEPDAFARLQMALLLCLPGSVSLYQGEELGLPTANVPRQRLRDPFGISFYPVFAGRDGSRTPLPWVAGAPNSGFSRAAETWLPVPPEHDPLAVDRQRTNPASLLSAYRRMLAWRKRHPALITGDLDLLDCPDPVLAFRRSHQSGSVVAAFNLAPEPVTVGTGVLPAFQSAEELGFTTAPDGRTLSLPPYGVALGIVTH